MYTVAVVDDDLYIGDMLEKALSQAGIQGSPCLFGHRGPVAV